MTARSRKTICTDDCCKARTTRSAPCSTATPLSWLVHGFALPALIPQVYLHYDPETVTRRAMTSGAVLERQRMDFLMLLPGRHRVVIELDGRHHYATADGTASPPLYAEMMVEDRRLRLAGYEVFRFGGHEFVDLDAGKRLATAFFTELLKRHGVLPS